MKKKFTLEELDKLVEKVNKVLPCKIQLVNKTNKGWHILCREHLIWVGDTKREAAIVLLAIIKLSKYVR